MAPRVKVEKPKAAAKKPATKPTKKDPAPVKTADAIVKTEPGSSSSSKEVLQVSRGALSALITSLKHQTKAKKATDEHKAKAKQILEEFWLHF